MLRRIVFVGVLSFCCILTNTAYSAVLYEDNESTVTLESKIEAEYDSYNFETGADLVKGSDNDDIYGFWDNTVGFDLISKYKDNWTARAIIEFSPFKDDSASVSESGEYMFTDEGIGYEDPEDAYGAESALSMEF